MHKKATIAIGLVVAMLTPLLAGLFAPLVGASSHREAPLIANDPAADGTDFYMFRSPDKPDSVTLLANYIPLQARYGGPNFHHPADEVLYSVKIDNNGDAEADIVYQWFFRSERRGSVLGGGAGDTYLYNDGSITSLNDANLLFRQTYDLYRIDVDKTKGQMWPDGTKGVRTLVAKGQVAPAFVGKESFCPGSAGSTFPPNPACTEDAAKANYEAIAASAIVNTSEGGKAFVGPRTESFYVDLAKVFDLARLGSLGYGAPSNNTAEFNITTLAIQVPISKLTKNGDPVIGGWTTASRQNTEIIRPGNVRARTGSFIQVSRLGMPLVNELVIGAKDKDKFNNSEPKDDVANFGGYVVNPRLAKILNALYAPVFSGGNAILTANRGDLVQIFVTGIPGLTRSANLTRGGEMLRLNTSIAPATTPNDLGALAGDTAGFPNGRRVTDDVVDVELTAVISNKCTGTDPVPALQKFGPTLPCTNALGGFLGDGVGKDGLNFLTSFPYLPTPHSATEAD
jgi:hypothetical protein